MTEFRENWPDMRMKHLELVQNAIIRMGSNSAALKGYCMAIVAALIALAGATGKANVLFLGLPVVLIFSVLDAAYLSLEKGFRDHYDQLRLTDLNCQPDFKIVPNRSHSIFKAYASWSVSAFYISAALTLIVIGLFV